MPPEADFTRNRALVLALFGILEELREMENRVLDTLARLTDPTDYSRAPHVLPDFREVDNGKPTIEH